MNHSKKTYSEVHCRAVPHCGTFQTILPAFLMCSLLSTASAEVRLPHLLDHNMVLQRDMPIPVWGWANANEKVTVRLGKSSTSATAGANGPWSVKLPKMPAGGPYEMTVAGVNTLTLTNVLIGEVWVCSGQSNMAKPIGIHPGQPLDHFTLAGEDKKFVTAKAAIDGKTVLVWSDAVAKPVAVRFGWRQDVSPNLMNKEGLPAPCFRTDKWN